MGTEATKTKAIWNPGIFALLQGEGIDIGCGPDPILPGVTPFDLPHGDANHITRYVQKQFDFVFSSHALEHMRDPLIALQEWFSLVKPGGHLIVLVPDEDLYEQGAFPSIFNSDHKHTFTLSKSKSWSPKSINILDLVNTLPGELISAELQDHGLDRSLIRHKPGRWARLTGRWAKRLCERFPGKEKTIVRLFGKLGAAIDQTGLSDPRLAQIQIIVRKAARA